MKKLKILYLIERFSFYDEDGKLVKVVGYNKVKYLDDQGAIELVFTTAVVQGISRIDGVKKSFSLNTYLARHT